MLTWLVAIAAGLAVALILYGAREPGRLPRVLPAAALRALALALLFALILDAPAGARRTPPPLVALDASASWLRGGDATRWRTARERARRLTSDTLWLFGDSMRAASPPEQPSDAGTRSAVVSERALAAGRPVVLITDGEVDDPASLGGLPAGSRIEVDSAPAMVDASIVALEAPRAAVSGDTAEITVVVRAGGAAVPAGALSLTLDVGQGVPRPLASRAIEALPVRGERRITVRAPLSGPSDAAGRAAVLAAAVTASGDRERRNDTLAVAVELVRAAGAVLASTSPDLDARFLVPVLRGAVSLPTRAYYRVAPGNWRLEGSLARVEESEVRAALREAPLVILHGDTTAFGPPRTLGAGALVLLPTPPPGNGEWFAGSAPASPVSSALTGLPLDSLPPLDLAPASPRGEWDVLAVTRAGGGERRTAIAGSEQPRRVVVSGATGYWRWAFRGGAGADAFTALWGSIFDWASAARSDRRAALPAEPVVRAGERLRWRRGVDADSIVAVSLRRRGAPSGDTLVLRFGSAGTVAESEPLAAGVYDLDVAGERGVLVVNVSRELLPRVPTVRSGATAERTPAGEQPRLRDRGWPYMLALAALCAEWLLRRRLGLR